MRRKRSYIFGATVLLVVATVVGASYAATADQTFQARVIPNNFAPKFTFVNKGIRVAVSVEDADNPGGIPPKANRVLVDFDRHIRFLPRGFRRCGPAQLENTTTEQAMNRCGRARIGQGNAQAALPVGGGGARVDFPAVVTAFNGVPMPNGRPRIFLHSRIGPPINATAVLTGVLQPGAPGARFGRRLNVTIPPIAGGAGAIAEFAVNVRRARYVQARCRQNRPVQRFWQFRAIWFYNDAPSVTTFSRHNCRQTRRS